MHDVSEEGLRACEISPRGPRAHGSLRSRTSFTRKASHVLVERLGQMIRANSVSPGNTYFPGGVWAFLASPAASFITGTNLVVDGALTKGVQF